MHGGIPAIKVAGILDGEVDTADKRYLAIYHGAFLVQSLRQMEHRATVLVQPTPHALPR